MWANALFDVFVRFAVTKTKLKAKNRLHGVMKVVSRLIQEFRRADAPDEVAWFPALTSFWQEHLQLSDEDFQEQLEEFFVLVTQLSPDLLMPAALSSVRGHVLDVSALQAAVPIDQCQITFTLRWQDGKVHDFVFLSDALDKSVPLSALARIAQASCDAWQNQLCELGTAALHDHGLFGVSEELEQELRTTLRKYARNAPPTERQKMQDNVERLCDIGFATMAKKKPQASSRGQFPQLLDNGGGF